MQNRIISLSTAAALTLAALGTSAIAGTVNDTKTIGAMSIESRGVATTPAEIRRQGGFTTAATAQWSASAPVTLTGNAVANGTKTIGAMAVETQGRATSPDQVRRQGGLLVPGAIRWVAKPAIEAKAVSGVGTIGAMLLETRGRATSASDVRRQGTGTTAAAVRWVSAPAAR